VAVAEEADGFRDGVEEADGEEEEANIGENAGSDDSLVQTRPRRKK